MRKGSKISKCCCTFTGEWMTSTFTSFLPRKSHIISERGNVLRSHLYALLDLHQDTASSPSPMLQLLIYPWISPIVHDCLSLARRNLVFSCLGDNNILCLLHVDLISSRQVWSLTLTPVPAWLFEFFSRLLKRNFIILCKVSADSSVVGVVFPVSQPGATTCKRSASALFNWKLICIFRLLLVALEIQTTKVIA